MALEDVKKRHAAAILDKIKELMGDLGVDGDVIERCLNHVEPNRIKRTYQRQRTDAAKAEAWRLLGDRLELLTQANDANIVTLKRKA